MGLKDDLINRGAKTSKQKTAENIAKPPGKGDNISFFAPSEILDAKEQIFDKYGRGSFSKYVTKAIKEKLERDGGISLEY